LPFTIDFVVQHFYGSEWPFLHLLSTSVTFCIQLDVMQFVKFSHVLKIITLPYQLYFYLYVSFSSLTLMFVWWQQHLARRNL